MVPFLAFMLYPFKVKGQNCSCLNPKYHYDKTSSENSVSIYDSLKFIIPFEFINKNSSTGKGGYSFEIKIDDKIKLLATIMQSDPRSFDSLYIVSITYDSMTSIKSKIIKTEHCYINNQKTHFVIRSQDISGRKEANKESKKNKYIYYLDFRTQIHDYLYRITLIQNYGSLNKNILYKYLCKFLNANQALFFEN